MFHLKIENKRNGKLPLLSSILKFLHLGFLFILNNIKKFYNASDSHIAFMTLIQQPMLNAVNTGGFLLHDDTSPTEMVDRLLSLLNQYLISHKSLELNKTFKVYLKILSADHSKVKIVNISRTQKRHSFATSTKVGCNEEQFRAYWAIDVPPSHGFKNYCLLLSTIIALAQHEYFESNFNEKKYKYMEKIISLNKKKSKYASSLLAKELEILFNNTGITKQCQPYDLNQTIQKLSQHYKCQFFIFEGVIKSTHRLFLRYPDTYNSSLKPIFLYKPCNSNHLVFIRNLFSYYRKNGKTCLVCKKYYKTASYAHFCKKSKNCCFVCHRFIQTTTTYINSNLTKLFCDSKINRNLNETCSLCQVKLYSSSCKAAHRLLCNSKGFFGYFCNLCQKFNYGSSGTTSDILKQHHICNRKTCKFCYKPNYPNIMQIYVFFTLNQLIKTQLLVYYLMRFELDILRTFLLLKRSLDYRSTLNQKIY